MSNEDLAKAAMLNMLKFHMIKWGIIIGVTKIAKRAAKKAAS